MVCRLPCRYNRLGCERRQVVTPDVIGGFFQTGLLTMRRRQQKYQTLERTMPKFVIEREIPDAGKLSSSDLQAISQKSCSVLRELGTDVQWVESYVTDSKIYCIYLAKDEQLVREHAQRGGFPANRVSQVRQVIDPTTAEA
jgi:hypothetical protein